MKVTDGVYAYVWNGVLENNCNSYYFGEPLNILFDPGLKNYTDELLRKMEEDGIDIETISYVLADQDAIKQYWPVILGVVLLLVVMYKPTGILGLFVSDRERIGSYGGRKASARSADETAANAPAEKRA